MVWSNFQSSAFMKFKTWQKLTKKTNQPPKLELCLSTHMWTVLLLLCFHSDERQAQPQHLYDNNFESSFFSRKSHLLIFSSYCNIAHKRKNQRRSSHTWHKFHDERELFTKNVVCVPAGHFVVICGVRDGDLDHQILITIRSRLDPIFTQLVINWWTRWSITKTFGDQRKITKLSSPNGEQRVITIWSPKRLSNRVPLRWSQFTITKVLSAIAIVCQANTNIIWCTLEHQMITLFFKQFYLELVHHLVTVHLPNW